MGKTTCVCGSERLDGKSTCGNWRCGSSTGNRRSPAETMVEALRILRMTPDERLRLIRERLRPPV